MSITKEFVTAGKAVFTLEVAETFATQYKLKPHYTFRVRHKPASQDGQYREAWFVQLLTGPENTRDFTYLGMLDPETGKVRGTAKSALNPESLPFRLLNRALELVWKGDTTALEDAGFQLHHEGRCGRCSRPLTVPLSIMTGIGPECAGRMR